MTLINWYNRNFILFEFCLVLVLSSGFVIWGEVFSGSTSINNWLFGIRKELYSTIASISGALLGFIITSISIVIIFVESDKLELLRKSKNYETLYRVFIAAIKYLAFTTLIAIIGLVADKDLSPHNWIMYLVFFGVLLSIFSLGRCIWVIEKLISIITSRSTN